jgi:excisionase family DNA binding protein
MGPRLRISAWLPPGLALGGLAVLATFVHGAGRLLIVWAATCSVVVLLVLLVRLARRRPVEASGVRPGTESALTAEPDEASPAIAELSPVTDPEAAPLPSDLHEEAANSALCGPAGQEGQLATAETSASLELRVLTAAEVASVLRVDADLITRAIRDGEFPGNRIGNHWRVDYGALVRWLQGKYRDPADPPGSPSPEQLRTGPR